MLALTEAVYNRMVGDGTLTALLATYRDEPAVFTTDPAPGDAALPFIVSAGQWSDSPNDTKTTRGRDVFRDVRCYADRDGSVDVVEAIAERVRTLFHRYSLFIEGFGVVVARCTGPVSADEQDVYGRIVTVEWVLQEV